ECSVTGCSGSAGLSLAPHRGGREAAGLQGYGGAKALGGCATKGGRIRGQAPLSREQDLISSRILLALVLTAVLSSCGRSRREHGARLEKDMRVHSEYDFLLDAKSTRDVYAQHVHDGSDDVALVRAALREDARVQVRRNAIVALSASLKERGVPDYIY